MRSKTSYFNKTLFLKNLSRFWPLWGGASFIGALFPLALLSNLLQNGSDQVETPLVMTSTYYFILRNGVPLICLLYGVLCALAVWSYLYNARSAGLMHTLPIRREGLFVTNFLSGLAMLLVPFAVTGALSVVVTAAFGIFEPVGVLATILGVLGESFFYFSSATLAALITGNVFAMPVLYLGLHFLEAALDVLLSDFAGGFIFGFTEDYTGLLEFLSPTVYLMRNVRVNTEWQEITNYAGEHIRNELVSATLENAWIIAVYALVGAALLAAAFVLYRRRSSEAAGDVVAVGWMKPVFRYGVAALAALLGGRLIYSLLWNDEYFRVAPLAVCMLVAGFIGWYAASMLLARTLRVFRRDNWRGLALVAAGIVVVCGALELDVFHAALRVPELNRIETLEFYTSSNNYTFYPGQGEDGLMEQVRALHAAIAADQDYIKDFDRETALAENPENLGGTSVTFTYTTTGGEDVIRRYYLPLIRDRMGQAGTYDHLLDELVNCQEMRLKRLHATDDGFVPTDGSVYLNVRQSGSSLSDREAAAVLEAVTRDARAGLWGDVEWFGTAEDRGETYAMDLSLYFRREDGLRKKSDWITINVRPEMTATTACLLELGLATREELVTYAELYPEEYAGKSTAGYQVSLPSQSEVVYAERSTVTAATMGRIG